MGGENAPDDLEQGYETQAWLAVSEEAAARVTGEYFYHKRPRKPNPAARDQRKQDILLEACERFSGVRLPRH
jgi:hypothetical protein